MPSDHWQLIDLMWDEVILIILATSKQRKFTEEGSLDVIKILVGESRVVVPGQGVVPKQSYYS